MRNLLQHAKGKEDRNCILHHVHFHFSSVFSFVKMGPSLKVRFSKFYGPEPEVDMSTFIKLA